MKRRGLVALAAAFLGVQAVSTAAAAGEVEASVLAAQDKRIAATVAADVAALEAMMTDDLSYTHSSGVVETKAEFLEALKSHKYVYKEIAAEQRTVRVYGDAAVVAGPCRIVIAPGGNPTELRLYFTELYVKRGGRWLMALWHSTRLPATSPP